MSPELAGIIGIFLLLFSLFFLGMPVGFSMAVVGFFGFAQLISFEAAMGMISADLWASFSSYGLTAIPLFVFMGYLAFYSGIAEKLYKTAYTWFGSWRGGLAIATIGADELFAAICGSNTATAATMGAIALPQMKKYEYDPRLSSGTVATGGTLGSVMPPSVILIIIGLQTEQSIIKLFMAGILPAAILGLLFILTIIVLCQLHPTYGPAGPKTDLKEKILSLKGLFDAIAIFALVIGGLYMGLFTPTEAGAAGVFLTLLVTVPAKKIGMKDFLKSIRDTIKVSCMAFVLVTGAIVFGRFMAVTRIPFELAEFAAGLPVSNYLILLIILGIYFIGGCFVDALGFLVLTIPIFFPLGMALGFDPVWFAIILTMVTTMGAITPPVGVNIYVVKALSMDISIAIIYKSASYFLLACLLCIIILTIFPDIVLYIPSFMK
ncbi:MAG: TRAP transporter large permease [Desulfobacteraceae bacterium]|jgi:tripartite ATP-independent transporter DctM subunit